VWFSGNQEDLRRAVWNLVENALKYLQQPQPEPPEGAAGTGQAGGDAEPKGAGTITLRLTVDAGFAVVTVHDTGIGISEEDQRLVFDRFWRAAQARGHAGSGLGLAITKWVAQAHGGSVSVSSELGGGSTFSLRLPRIAAPSPARAQTPAAAEPQPTEEAAAR
jgi:signal transduction histidine kinase